MPNCIILRGLPGSGKSTVSKQLDSYAVSADRFFLDVNGKYVFDKSKLHEAHEWCFNEFKALVARQAPIVVDNTNTTRKEYERYSEHAKQNGYTVSVVTVETDLTDEELSKRNIHGVPVETIRRMRERMKNG